MENAEKTGITTLGSGDLGLEPENIGASASPTWVEDIRIVENNRLGLVIENENSVESNCEQAVGHIKNILANMNESEQGEVSNNFVRNPESETQIWVVSESEEGKLKPVSFELLGNYYDGLTSGLTNGAETDRVLGGHDISIVGQVPYLPWASLVY